jgi:hypothetical protein
MESMISRRRNPMIAVSRRFAPVVAAAVISASVYALIASALAQENPATWHEGLPLQHKSKKWRVHDLDRPKPTKVTPGEEPGAPPSDAIVLFDGKGFDAWKGRGEGGKVEWILENGSMQLANKGDIETKQHFGDCQFHIEWANPAEPRGVSQARGNSGVFFLGNHEVQILDNFDNPTYADGYAAGVYGQYPPLVNACRPSGEWQTYDIVFRAPRFTKGEGGEPDVVVEPARITIFHNGLLTAHDAEVYGNTAWRQLAKYGRRLSATGPIRIQDHGDRQAMRFRNIWVRPLDLSPSE